MKVGFLVGLMALLVGTTDAGHPEIAFRMNSYVEVMKQARHDGKPDVLSFHSDGSGSGVTMVKTISVYDFRDIQSHF